MLGKQEFVYFQSKGEKKIYSDYLFRYMVEKHSKNIKKT